MKRRATKTETLWLSLYCQFEEAAARHLAAKYGLHLIEPSECPPSHATNERGAALRVAIVLPAEHVAELDRVAAELRA